MAGDLLGDSIRSTVGAGRARFVVQETTGPPGRRFVQLQAEGEVDFRGPRGIRRDRADDALLSQGRRASRLVDIATVWLEGDVMIEEPIDAGRRGPARRIGGSFGQFLSLQTATTGSPEESLTAELAGRSFGEVGGDAVRSQPATRYRSGRGPGDDDSSLDVWIGAGGRIVRLTRSGTVTGTELPSVLVLDLYDFGAPLDLPPAPTVANP